jgi:hypothetical protein
MKLLEEMEQKRTLKKHSSIVHKNLDMAKENELRASVLKKNESFFPSDFADPDEASENPEQEEQKIIKAEVPRDVKNLKAQYEVLLKKFKQKEFALQDAEADHNDNNEEMVTNMRDQKRDVQFYTKLIMCTIGNDDLEKLRLKSKWKDSDNSFVTPGFLMNSKKLTFPKIPKYELIQTWQQIQSARYLVFPEDLMGETGQSFMSGRSPVRSARNMGNMPKGHMDRSQEF